MDERRIGNGATIEADLVVVGGGVCGLVLARELAHQGQDVLLLESGSRRHDPAAQLLNAGEVVGDAYAGLAATRHRQLGGTAHAWNTPVGRGIGAKYAPLDHLDLVDWPFPAAELEGWYEMAQAACGLGPFAYDAEAWRDPARPAWEGPGDLLETRVYQFGRAALFTTTYPAELVASREARVLTGATLIGLRHEGGQVRELAVGLGGHRSFTVRGGAVVLAAGGVENARLLLANGFRHEWLGRGFMEHPRDYSMVLVPPSPDHLQSARFYDAHRGADGTIVGGRLGLTPDARRRESLPNASITLLPRRREVPATSVRRLLRRLRLSGAPPGGGYGWSAQSDLARDFDAFRLVVNLEQRPHRENRIVLGTSRDGFGVPRAELHYRWRPEEQIPLDRFRRLLGPWFQEGGHGRLEFRQGVPPDPNAHHHMGATRMAHDPAEGVVTADGRVHGTTNLFVVGSSTFPSGGFANPTLTAVALSLRLARHLRAR